MSLTDEEVREALANKNARTAGQRGRPRIYTDQQAADRQKAASRAAADAKAALVRLHEDEYSALYQAAVVERRKELGFDS